MTPEQIAVPTDRLTAPILRLVESTALADCCTTGYDGGVRTVRADRPVASFSTGEQHLWALLSSLCGGEMRTLLEHADSVTTAALADFWGRVTLEGRLAS